MSATEKTKRKRGPRPIPGMGVNAPSWGLRLPVEDLDFLLDLGGASWVRAQIAKARAEAQEKTSTTGGRP